MKSYLTQIGLSLLQTSLAAVQDPPDLSFTGFQIGSTIDFIPQEDMNDAQGNLLLDYKYMSNGVKLTPISLHEIICSIFIDRFYEFSQIGNALLFVNNKPFLWLIYSAPVGKLKTNNITHFAGEKAQLSIVFRFPYIRKLLNLNNQVAAVFPRFEYPSNVVITAHTLAEQCSLEKNFSFREDAQNMLYSHKGHWYSSPFLSQPYKNNLCCIDGGSTRSGL